MGLSAIKPFGLGVAAALALTGGALADDGHGHPMMWQGAGWMMLLGPLMMLLLLAGFAALVVLGVRWLQSSGHAAGGAPGTGTPVPLDILKERLARGEIDVAEYEERRRALNDG